ncbi:hypothetical protein Ae168Ps1_0045c [Pseudonocardia sp. Ae168_Ps1]|uniref:hypothetical protein n=1 Tax=unclassified Pseudonocardia TaxID=2619320 RepID=UPI00094B6A86|nr:MULTISPECIES: hypothetical protein [unclassified Pseudonocardia]OLL71664.1 hypothetical protein Ae150APs1_0042c [Pseudonocardia sp. Ae150A_Ps1]OLL77639.1 hypothetical protein Ae168Ps1_0045c [Pseudonocardia sp. Ae168_Ps1]OLL88237.1 hypothetical protein Ae263Ps1_5292 [Pseudonocardia sp. Ae263_Ps1]OLL91731.1 hypothetical protein Ae356Ps1_1628c [Pseudonocardia sp. Ae356_Ps1]
MEANESEADSADGSGIGGPADTAGTAVAVVSDGSRHSQHTSRRSLNEALATDAEIVAGLGGFAADPVVVPASTDGSLDVTGLLDALEKLPRRYRAVFLTRTRVPSDFLDAVHGRADLPLVLSEQAASMTVLCASALAHLRRTERTPLESRVLLAGAHLMPDLGPLLMLAGFYHQTFWSDRDRQTISLERTSDLADVVIDVRQGSAPAVQTALIAQNFPDGAVIRPTGLDARTLVAPGILRVALESPPTSIQVRLPLLRRCAEALAQSLPLTMPWPGLSEDQRGETVTKSVADAVRRGLDPRIVDP